MADPVTSVATAVTSVADLIGGILNRADRDGPEKEYEENITTIQNAFGDNSMDSDDFRRFVSELCLKGGQSLTPTGDVSAGKREYLHASLCIIAQSIRDRKLLMKSIFALQNK